MSSKSEPEVNMHTAVKMALPLKIRNLLELKGSEYKAVSDDIAEATLPVVLLSLLKKGKLDRRKMSDHEYVLSVVFENLDTLDEMGGFYCIHEDFAESAEDAIAADRLEVAVVLVATAVEHILNEFYREVLAPRLSDEVITEVLRSKLHVKLGWLMTLAVGRSIPSELENRIKRLADLRNAFVHHKCVPFKLGDPVGESYYHRLVEQVRDLGLESLHSIPRELQNELEAILEEVDSDYQLAKETAKVIDALSDG